MSTLRVFTKTPLLVFIISIFFILGILNKCLFFFSKKLRQSVAQRNTQWACKCCLKVFNIKVQYKLSQIPTGALLVSNHISYTDVLIIASKIPTLFVTSLELKRTPFLGQITWLGECLYVNRLSHKDLSHEIHDLKKTLQNDHNVLVFPEATTSDGLTIKPYKSSLLKVTDHLSAPIFNYCTKYTHTNQTPLDANNKTSLSWTNKQSFLGHAIKLMSYRSIQADFLEVNHFMSSDFKDRKELAQNLYQNTTEIYNSY